MPLGNVGGTSAAPTQPQSPHNVCCATQPPHVGVTWCLTHESKCVTNRLMTRDAHLSVRVPADLKQALERLAASEQRTLASYVHFVLHQHVEEQAGNKSRKSPR
jgi:hypothetical protein